MVSKSHSNRVGRSDHSRPTRFDLSSPDEMTGLCSEWLARHAEQEKLVQRWQRLETRLIREHDWFKLSKQDRSALTESCELDAINARLSTLAQQNQELLDALPIARATSMQGIISKLSVALANIHADENNAVFQLMKSILRDIETVGEYQAAGG